MPAARWADIVEQGAGTTITTIGTQAGPPGGDGWVIVARLPASGMPIGSRKWGVIVQAHVHNLTVSNGTALPRALLQLSLGKTGGFRSSTHTWSYPVWQSLGALSAVPVQFMFVQTALSADPSFGAATTLSSSADELCIWGRFFANGDVINNRQMSASVSELTWLWWDLTTVPAGDQLVEQYWPASLPLTSSNSPLWMTTNQPGVDGEKWLHFMGVNYRPPGRDFLVQRQAPSFQLGMEILGTPAFLDAKVGSNGRWGLSRGFDMTQTAFSWNPIMQQVGWWYGTNPVSASASYRPGIRGNDRASLTGTSRTLLLGVKYLGIRVQSLADVLDRTEQEVLAVTGNRYGGNSDVFPEGQTYLSLERPATGLVSAPAVLTHGIVQTTGTHDYCAEIWTNAGNALRSCIVHAQTRANELEGVSVIAAARYGLSPTSGAIQYRARWTGGLNVSNSRRDVRDAQILQVNLVKDADPDPTLPATATYLVLTPGRESASAASLNPLPIAPNADASEDAQVQDERIVGATGYVRSWPLFATVRRQWVLTWSNLNGANSSTLYDFLRDNVAFRWRAPRESTDIAVVQTDAPQLEQVSGHVYALSVRIVQLIWTF